VSVFVRFSCAASLGATHSQALENWFANTPGLKVVVPSTVYDAKGFFERLSVTTIL
jgi:pyruvate/2-oxoglutarate/acetoin dehydrogenase E1 component